MTINFYNVLTLISLFLSFFISFFFFFNKKGNHIANKLLSFLLLVFFIQIANSFAVSNWTYMYFLNYHKIILILRQTGLLTGPLLLLYALENIKRDNRHVRYSVLIHFMPFIISITVIYFLIKEEKNFIIWRSAINPILVKVIITHNFLYIFLTLIILKKNSITSQMYDTLGFNDYRADVCFLCYDYIRNVTKLNNFKNKINPRFSTISHIDSYTSYRYKELRNTVNELNTDYPMNLLTTPGDKLLFMKTADTILVDTLHIANIDLISPINDINENDDMILYPNPSNGNLFILSDNIKACDIIKLYDLKGNNLQINYKNASNRILINLDGIKPGMYIIEINNNFKKITKKIFIN